MTRPTSTLLDRLTGAGHGAPPPPGSLSADTVRARWDDAAVALDLPDGRTVRLDEHSPVTLQLSRWRRAGKVSLWAAITGRVPVARDELHVEVRADTLRLSFVARCDAGALEGLPWLAGDDAIEADGAALVSLLEALRAHGARLAHATTDAAQARAAPETLVRSLTRRQIASLLFDDVFMVFGMLWTLIAAPMAVFFLRSIREAGWPTLQHSTDAVIILAVAAAFVLIGAVCLLVGARRGLRAVRLTHQGRLVRATVQGRRSTSVKINGKDVVAVQYELVGHDGRVRTATYRTHEAPLAHDAIGTPRLVLVDPDVPRHVYPVDALPRGLTLDEHGQVHGRGPSLPLVLAVALPCVIALALIGALIV